MSPTLNHLKTSSKNNIINNYQYWDPINNSIPILEPILEFDRSHVTPNEANDQIDGNLVSIVSNINNNNVNIDNKEDMNNRIPLKCETSFDNKEEHSFNATQALVRRQAPTFLLIESLIWSICANYESEVQKQKFLFRNICERLENYKIVGTSYKSDSLQPIRDLIVIKIKELVSSIRSDDNYANHVIPSSCPKTDLILDSTAHLINHSSRFYEEFIDLGLIEEGGFGVVNKAKHRFDDCEYAVKLIKFRYKTDTDFKKITREVQLYANLASHPNVVAYKTAWLENWCLHKDKTPLAQHNQTRDQPMVSSTHITTADDVSIRFEETSKSGLRIERSQTKFTQTQTQTCFIESKNRDYFESSDDDSDDSEIFDEDEDGEEDRMSTNSEPNYNVMMRSSDNSSNNWQTVRMCRKKTISMSSTKSQSDSAIEYGHCNKVQKYDKFGVNGLDANNCTFSCINFGAVLYIQMELCGKNLKTWIRERNDKIFSFCQNSCNEMLSQIDSKASLNIFRQVLKGVDYIHSQHLIHRDLKPQNILFSNDGNKIKIGDFGLSTIHNSIDNEEIALHNYKRSTRADPLNHTGGVGTSIYCAPEQKVGNNYDNKTDLYSLGIILFELFFPLSTDMEKVKCVSDITKKRAVPKSLEKRWPNVAEMILKLTNTNPGLRPHALEVLQSSLFLNKDQQMIKYLKEQIKSKDKQLDQKDIEIDNLRKQIQQLQLLVNKSKD